MCGLLDAIAHGECQHDLLPEDGHDAYLSDSQWRHQSINGREKRRRGGVCASMHVQERDGWAIFICSCNMGTEPGFQKWLGRATVTYRESRSEKIKKLTETTFNQKRREPAYSVLDCLQERCACEHNAFHRRAKSKKNQPEKGQE